MLRIDCPFCGLRDHAEYAYGGDAGLRRPAPDNADPGTWHDYVYLRGNPKGIHREFWCHTGGCREWLVVQRDTATHKILSVIRARTSAVEPRQGAGPEGPEGPAGEET